MAYVSNIKILQGLIDYIVIDSNVPERDGWRGMPKDLLQQSDIPVLAVVPITKCLAHGMGTDWIVDSALFGRGIQYRVGMDPRNGLIIPFIGRDQIVLSTKMMSFDIILDFPFQMSVDWKPMEFSGFLVAKRKMIPSHDILHTYLQDVRYPKTDVGAQKPHHVIFLIPFLQVFFQFLDLFRVPDRFNFIHYITLYMSIYP